MKTLNPLSMTIALAVLLVNCSKSDDVVPQKEPEKHKVLIAHYPLINDGLDVTGLNAPMNLQIRPFKMTVFIVMEFTSILEAGTFVSRKVRR
jgi:hypothetical protein